jgi:hypothetical protein
MYLFVTTLDVCLNEKNKFYFWLVTPEHSFSLEIFYFITIEKLSRLYYLAQIGGCIVSIT